MLIIDYDAGNLRNVQKLVEALGEDAAIGNSVEAVNNASSYLLAGVGAFYDAMTNLNELKIVDALRHNVLVEKKPLLGICLGMQLLGLSSEEGSAIAGLGFLDLEVKKIKVGEGYRLPHMGWNDIRWRDNSLLLKHLPLAPDLYFVHSYHAVCNDNTIIAATCDYDHELVAAVEKENVFGVQFHPEKSQSFGRIILSNYMNYCRENNAL